MVNGISTQAPASDSPPVVATESAKRPSSKKKAGHSKKLVARRGPHRASGEEAIELAVSSSDEDGHASSGSESDDPDTEEEADLQIKKLALEKLSLERTDDPSLVAPNRAPPRKQHNRGRTASQESHPSPQPSSHNRDSAPASPTPSLSSPAPNATSVSSKKKRSRKAKQDQKQGQAPVTGDNKEDGQSQKNGADETQQLQSTTPSSSSSAPPAQSQQPTDPEPYASSKASKRISKQGGASSKSNVASPSPAKDIAGDESPTADWGDSPMPEPSPVAEKSSEIGQNQQQQQQSKSTAQMGRAASRGRGGKAAVEARVEYRKKLAEDPRFVPHLGEFWGHDDRYRGAGLKNFSDRGGFRGRSMGRGGFGRGGMTQGPTRGDFRNESPTADKESPSQEPEDKDDSSAKPKTDRWSHDGYDQLMKVHEKSYRHQRNDSRPRSMNVKATGVPLSRTESNNPGPGEGNSSSSTTPTPSTSASISVLTTEASKTEAASNVSPKTGDGTTAKSTNKEKDVATITAGGSQDKKAGRSQEESTPQAGSASTSTKAERPRSSAQFGEKDVKRASRLLHSALPKPSAKTPATETAPAINDANSAGPGKAESSSKDRNVVSTAEKTNTAATSTASGTAAPGGAPVNVKFRQPMPQSQPAVHHAGFRPHFIPGNFSSRGRGRGQFHPGHPMNFGHRGGHHHGGFHGHNQHHQHHPQQPQAMSAVAAPTNKENSMAGSTQDQPETMNTNGSKRYLGNRQEGKDEEISDAVEDKKTEYDQAESKESSSKSLRTAINAVPFKPSTTFIPAEQPATEFSAEEEEFYGEDYGQNGYYYDPQQQQQQQQQMAQSMYYYYYPPMPNGNAGSVPASMPMSVPVPMGMPMGMPMGVPMPGQPFMAPMYYDGGGVPVSGPLSPPGGGVSTAASPVPGPNGEMMMMMMATPEDYNNYYYYQPTMYYPPHPPAQQPDPHHQHQISHPVSIPQTRA